MARLALIVLMLFVGVSAARAGPTPERAASGEARERGAGAGARDPLVDEYLREGMQKLHAANVTEVQLGKLAIEKAQSQRVREFATTMVEEHVRNDRLLQRAADLHSVDLAGDAFEDALRASKDEIERLRAITPSTFDEEYMAHAVRAHEEVATLSGLLAERGRNEDRPGLTAFFEDTHRAVSSHLQDASRTAAQVGSPPPEPTAGTRPSIPEQTLSGTVSRVRPNDGKLLISSESGQPTEIWVQPQTVILIEGRNASLGQVSEGSEVRARYELREGEPVALRIEVFQRPPESPRGRGAGGR